MNSEFNDAGKPGEPTTSIYFFSFNKRTALDIDALSQGKAKTEEYEMALIKLYEKMQMEAIRGGVAEDVSGIIDYTVSDDRKDWGIIVECTDDAAQFFSQYFGAAFDAIEPANEAQQAYYMQAFGESAPSPDESEPGGCCGGTCGGDCGCSNDEEKPEGDGPGCGGNCGGGCGGPRP